MKSKLNIILFQIPLFWEEPRKNRAYIDKYFREQIIEADILFLPEMFSTGFTMNAELVAETMNGPTIKWMKDWSSKLGLLLGGSLVINENGKFFNRFVIVEGQNIVTYYDKRHTFTFAGEDKFYDSGKNSGLFEFEGWKICLRICYDLRFPVWSRNTEGYDLLIFVANWPSARINAWDILLQARAIENMSYVVGANRIGADGNGLIYPGHSAVYSPLGKSLTGDLSSLEGIIRAELDYSDLQLLRKQLKFLNDQDSFDLC